MTVFEYIAIFGFICVFGCTWTIVKQLDKVIDRLCNIENLIAGQKAFLQMALIPPIKRRE
jgi:hypothetical protein